MITSALGASERVRSCAAGGAAFSMSGKSNRKFPMVSAVLNRCSDFHSAFEPVRLASGLVIGSSDRLVYRQ